MLPTLMPTLMPTLDMHTLLLGSTLVDVVAIAVLAWLVRRAGRVRDAARAAQREALETLRRDLATLVADAEERTRALEESLGRRERSLGALLAKLERAERRPDGDTPRPAAAPSGGLPELARRLGLRGKRGGGAPAEAADPAEARLLRDLEIGLGRGGTR
ncbi:MAG: hypothetical protein E6J83_12895 [Deltaproteobacteria bacterium]|nr:MAG: hypothetical protein E6J83_12895 [Deltaproteobacteria bacterium]